MLPYCQLNWRTQLKPMCFCRICSAPWCHMMSVSYQAGWSWLLLVFTQRPMWWDRCCESWLCTPSGNIIQSAEPKGVEVVTYFGFSSRIWPQIISVEIKPIFGLALYNSRTVLFRKCCWCIFVGVLHHLRWGSNTRNKLVKVFFFNFCK